MAFVRTSKKIRKTKSKKRKKTTVSDKTPHTVYAAKQRRARLTDKAKEIKYTNVLCVFLS